MTYDQMLVFIVMNATIALFHCPIALNSAAQLQASPHAFLMAVAIGVSCAFLTSIGHQNNTLILSPGGFRFGDYWRLGPAYGTAGGGHQHPHASSGLASHIIRSFTA
ncbi:MAG: hypothetical protein WCR47_08045 [Desulfoplanes sp.]|nr:hypothetical protein [Desulfoplanes sp.]